MQRRKIVHFAFVDPNSPQEPAPAVVRNLLPVPSEVAENVEKEAARAQIEHGITLAPEAKQRMLNQGTLDWYYRDHWVSFRESAQGVEVLAVGLDAIGELARRLTEQERAGLQTKLV
jgi:hypothetical protein